MPRFLFVVSREKPDLCDYLARHFVDEPDVLITLDRRRGERRRRRHQWERDRRLHHRRWRPDNDETLTSLGAFLVPTEEDPTRSGE